MAAPEISRVIREERAARLRGIYVIVNEGVADPRAIARAALNAGIRIVQYRAKAGIVAERLRDLRALTLEKNALLIVNDDPRAAIDFDCDGVHLGPDDGGFDDLSPARAALGDRLIGVSCATVAEAQAAGQTDVDYLGVGAVYATRSKRDAGDPIGVDGLQRVMSASRFPVAAIGGIGVPNVAAIARSGVAMAAVISAIADDPDPERAALRLVRTWDAAVPP